jgi:hypothetical protein
MRRLQKNAKHPLELNQRLTEFHVSIVTGMSPFQKNAESSVMMRLIIMRKETNWLQKNALPHLSEVGMNAKNELAEVQESTVRGMIRFQKNAKRS